MIYFFGANIWLLEVRTLNLYRLKEEERLMLNVSLILASDI